MEQNQAKATRKHSTSGTLFTQLILNNNPDPIQPTAEIKNVINFLRNKSGMKTKVGALGGKRADYFKGDRPSLLFKLSFHLSRERVAHFLPWTEHVGRSAVKALLSPSYLKLKNVPTIADEAAASTFLNSVIPFTFFLRVNRGVHSGSAGSPRVLQINPQQAFIPDDYYVWLIDPNPLKLMLGAIGMVLVVLAAVMFPLWPAKLRVGVWYLSVGVLGLIGLFFAIAIFRLIFYVITIVVAKPGIWIFPNLFADVGFVRPFPLSVQLLPSYFKRPPTKLTFDFTSQVDSFIPLWGWDIPPPKKSRSSKKSKKDKLAAGGGTASGGSGTATPTGTGTGEGAKIVELVDGEE